MTKKARRAKKLTKAQKAELWTETRNAGAGWDRNTSTEPERDKHDREANRLQKHRDEEP